MPPLWSAFLALYSIEKYQKTTECTKNICPAIQSVYSQERDIRLKHKIVPRLNNSLPRIQSIEAVLVLLPGEIEFLLHAREVELVNFTPELVVGLLCFRLLWIRLNFDDCSHVVRLPAEVVTHQPPRLAVNVRPLRPNDLLRDLEGRLLPRDVRRVTRRQDRSIGLFQAVGRLPPRDLFPGRLPARLVRRGDLDLRELAGLRRRRLHRGQAREGRAPGLCEDFPARVAALHPSHCAPLLRWRGRLGDQENSLRRLAGGAHQRDEPEKEKSRNCCGAAVHRSCSSGAR